MPRLIASPALIGAAGTKPKRIEEYAGRVRSGHERVSVARMISPAGWAEPGQRPGFEEITVVLRGMLRVEHEGGALEVRAGQAVVCAPGEWVRYSTPGPGGVRRRLPPRLLARDGAPGCVMAWPSRAGDVPAPWAKVRPEFPSRASKMRNIGLP